MEPALPLNISVFRWKGFWRDGVSRTQDGVAAFTADGLAYYAFWHRRFQRPVPKDAMNYNAFVLEFLTVMKLREMAQVQKDQPEHYIRAGGLG